MHHDQLKFEAKKSTSFVILTVTPNGTYREKQFAHFLGLTSLRMIKLNPSFKTVKIMPKWCGVLCGQGVISVNIRWGGFKHKQL